MIKTDILLAQINPCVGDISGNQKKISDIIRQHPNHQLIIFPELAICGYPPEDLLLYPEFHQEIEHAIQEIAQIATQSIIIVGTIHEGYNAAAIIEHQKVRYYYKHILPNYGVFDEKRYFKKPTTGFLKFTHQKHRFGLMICEDIWDKDYLKQLHDIDTLVSIHASPYEINKIEKRIKVMHDINQMGIHTIYVNQVGGQDSLVFDGQSMVFDKNHELIAKAKAFDEDLLTVSLHNNQWHGKKESPLTPDQEIYEALKLGLGDFMKKNGLKKSVLGLSGGIDSALALAIAADSMGAKNVHAILMPSQYTADASIEDAIAQANALGVSFEIIPIEPIVEVFKKTIQNPTSLTLQNLQARVRGVLLMAYSNQHQALLINTSNKSETAVGYGTLYGDMCGGYAPLQDIYKTKVYALAKYRNSLSPVIPERVITRAPSAELAPNQKDEDDLPAYEILDELLIDVIENRLTEQQLQEKFNAEMVSKILRKIKINEFKRYQAPPGCKVTPVAFGKDWRIPITHHWKI